MEMERDADEVDRTAVVRSVFGEGPAMRESAATYRARACGGPE